jgi:hypothetical protein
MHCAGMCGGWYRGIDPDCLQRGFRSAFLQEKSMVLKWPPMITPDMLNGGLLSSA